MKTILMLRSDNASIDGITVRRHAAGTSPTMPRDIADALILAGSAIDVTEQGDLFADLSASTSAPAARDPAAGRVDASNAGGLGAPSPAPQRVALPPVRTPTPVAPRAPAMDRGASLAKAREARKVQRAGSLSGQQNKSLSRDDNA